MAAVKKVGIFLFEGVAAMDFIGPYEVFNFANYEAPQPYFDIFTVGEQKGDVQAGGGLTVKAQYDIADCPQTDILVIPGGNITGELLANANIINWIRKQNKNTEITLSVCNGAMLLAKAGLLQGLSATTHHLLYEQLLGIDASINLMKKTRYVDTGKIVTSAGVSAGIDSSLHVVLRLYGEELAAKSVSFLEYESAAYKIS